MNDDPNQIEVPPSFISLHTTASGHRLLQPMAFVRERYELCEDLAQLLTEKATAIQSASGEREAQVLQQLRATLSGSESPVQPAEAEWVIARLAELLDWPAPDA
ncbi:ATPase with chaperone activity [Ramlibacter rhizophilus]|uniref:ATPase with chaperone activity n=1 Tax=Ramlibacter rhizophilus TaxID=1781167 RepID=A0A4Z0BYY1_9BURK|nr:ATPase with chaperone activity [Ramlibacter rhizophilus]TFZ04453.1 ATPase with chaperone activity [Ramlibacter rhizophilus]